MGILPLVWLMKIPVSLSYGTLMKPISTTWPYEGSRLFHMVASWRCLSRSYLFHTVAWWDQYLPCYAEQLCWCALGFGKQKTRKWRARSDIRVVNGPTRIRRDLNNGKQWFGIFLGVADTLWYHRAVGCWTVTDSLADIHGIAIIVHCGLYRGWNSRGRLSVKDHPKKKLSIKTHTRVVEILNFDGCFKFGNSYPITI